MKDFPLVMLIVPVHNNKEDTAEFLESLKRVTYPNYKVIIIDDGSTDGTEEMLKQEYPEVVLLKGDGNLWWAGATNIGIQRAIEMGADYVLLGGMNDTVVDGEFLSTLVDTAEQNPRSIVASKIYFYDEPLRIVGAGWDINWFKGGLYLVGFKEIDIGQYDVQRDTKAATLGVLVDTKFFKDIGLLDSTQFPQYRADVDFTYRAYKKGFRIIYEPRSKIWHKGRSTVKKASPASSPLSPRGLFYLLTSPRSLYNFKETTRFRLRHYPKWLLPYFLAHRYIPLFGSLILQAIHHRGNRKTFPKTTRM